MDKKTVFIKTAKGESEGGGLSSDLKRILSLIDNKSRADELSKRAPPSLRESWNEILGELLEGGYIVDKNKPLVEPKFAVPKINPLKMFVPKPVAVPPTEELDYNSMHVASTRKAAEQEARQKAEEEAKRTHDLEAAVAAAKVRANAEAAAKAEAKARQEVEAAARAKALAQAEAASRAETKTRQEAAIRAQAAAGANSRQESAARIQAEQEAARAKAALQSAVRARAEIEAAARAQQVAESKIKQEAAAARAKAAAEARVRSEIETAARAQQVAELKAKQDAEAARIKAEQETLIIRAELEAVAKAKAEAEAARLKAEEEAARIRDELAVAKFRAEAEMKALAEARVRQELEEKAKREAEAVRLKAEQEAAIARAMAEAAEKARREAEERARREAAADLLRTEQEVEARIRAETARVMAEQEAARIIAQQEIEAAAKREAEAQIKRALELEALARAEQAKAASATFEIKLDGFTGIAQPADRAVASAGHYDGQAAAEAEAKTRREAEQRAAAKAEAEKNSMQNIAAEMARLKEEAETARRTLEENARKQAEEKVLAEEQARAWAEAEQRAKTQALLEAAQQASVDQAKVTKKPVYRKQRKPLPLGKIASALIVLALLAIVVLPYVYPLDEYIAPLEQRLSARMRQPVHIGKLGANSVPPRLQFQNVTIGSGQEVKAGRIELSFDPFSIFSDVKVISNIDFQDVSIEGRTLNKQVTSLKVLGGDVQYPVRHLSLQRLKIITDEVALPDLSGIADIDEKGAFSRISLHSADNKLAIDLQPSQGHWQLGVNLKESSLPLLPEVVFSDLSVKGELGDGEINFTEMDGHIYNGILLGSAKFSWHKGWQLQGRFEAKTFELGKMFPRYHADGEMFGEGTFSMTGAKLSQLADIPRLEGSFTVKNGTVNGFDMVETVRLLSRENLVGGRTRFDDMAGQVTFENHTAHFRQLKITSGMLNANGLFDVSPIGQLSGNFNAEIKLRAGNNQLSLYGSLAEPKLRAGH
jgi:AsmA-like C-terminal region